MLHYSCNMDAGRCALADRYRFRLEFHWRRSAVPPDLDRMLSDYRKSLEQDGLAEAVQSVQYGSWRGLETESGGVTTWRFGRFFTAESCLVELVFVWPDGPDTQMAHHVLDSVSEEPVLKGLRCWRAFGMDMNVSDGLALQECTIKPAHAGMVFTKPGKSGRTETFRRLGMVDQWLGAPVADWLSVQQPEKARNWRPGRVSRLNHLIHYADATLPATGLRRLTRRVGSFQGAAWICPADERLYCATLTSGQPLSGKPELFDGGRLACCDDLVSQR